MSEIVTANGVTTTIVSTNGYVSIYPTEISQVFSNALAPVSLTNNQALLIVNYSAGATYLNFGASSDGLVAGPNVAGGYLVQAHGRLALGFGDLVIRFGASGPLHVAAMTTQRGEIRLSSAMLAAPLPNRDAGDPGDETTPTRLAAGIKPWP